MLTTPSLSFLIVLKTAMFFLSSSLHKSHNLTLLRMTSLKETSQCVKFLAKTDMSMGDPSVLTPWREWWAKGICAGSMKFSTRKS